MKKMTKNVWLALMLMLTFCVFKTQAQQKFDQYGYAIEPPEEGTSVVNNNQNTPKNVNKSSSQSEVPENTNYQPSSTTRTQTYSSTTSICCNHRTVNIVNVNVKLTAGGSNNTFIEQPQRMPNIVRVSNYSYPQNYYYPNPVMYYGPQYCNNSPRPRPQQVVYQQSYQQPLVQQTQPVQTYHGTFQNEVHGGQFDNGVHGGQFGNNSGGGTLNPPVTTGGGGGNGTVHHGKF
jgi:hypothetical protein